MKFVSGFPLALAAEHRAIVGELDVVSGIVCDGAAHAAYLLEMTSVK